MVDVYVTATELRDWRSITPDQFGVSDGPALDLLLERWSGHVKQIIDGHYQPPRDFLAAAGSELEQVPQAVRSVALRALSNYVTMAQNARESSYVRMDEFRVSVDLHDAILTRGMRRELPARTGVGTIRGVVAHGADDAD